MSTPGNIEFELENGSSLTLHVSHDGYPKYMIPTLYSLKVCADDGKLISWSEIYKFLKRYDGCTMIEYDTVMKSIAKKGVPFFDPIDEAGSYDKRNNQEAWAAYTYRFGYKGKSIKITVGESDVKMVGNAEYLNLIPAERTEYVMRHSFIELFGKRHYWLVGGF